MKIFQRGWEEGQKSKKNECIGFIKVMKLGEWSGEIGDVDNKKIVSNM